MRNDNNINKLQLHIYLQSLQLTVAYVYGFLFFTVNVIFAFCVQVDILCIIGSFSITLKVLTSITQIICQSVSSIGLK